VLGRADLLAHYSPEEPAYPPEIEEQFRKLREDIGRRAAAGDEVPYDSQNLRLVAFQAARGDGVVLPKLVLRFAPTRYFRMLATNQRIDVPLTASGRTYTLRERYAVDVDLRRVEPEGERPHVSAPHCPSLRRGVCFDQALDAARALHGPGEQTSGAE
jgi:hypothetical protein